jgi:hypothetical protein
MMLVAFAISTGIGAMCAGTGHPWLAFIFGANAGAALIELAWTGRQ